MPPPTKRPTLREVAAHAGVGFKTVSRVVNGEPGVAAQTVQRVQDSLAVLGYIPHSGAGALRRLDRRSFGIGLTIANVADRQAAQIHRGVEDEARAHGYATFSVSVDEDPGVEAKALEEFVRRRVDGLILTPVDPPRALLERTVALGTPVVCVDRTLPGLDLASVTVDNVTAAQLGTAHLIRHGHRDIAFLADAATIQTAQLRHRGYLQALQRAGLKPLRDPVFELRTVGDAQQAAHALLSASNPPSAIFAAQNEVTLGVLNALHALGLQHQVALLGFDDLPLGDLVRPGVSVIAQDLYLAGRRAAQRLLWELDPALYATDPAKTCTLPTELIPRGSGEIPGPHPSIERP